MHDKKIFFYINFLSITGKPGLLVKQEQTTFIVGKFHGTHEFVQVFVMSLPL